MKQLIPALTILLTLNVYAQETFEGGINLFIRVYDLKDEKISQGKIILMTDSLLVLRRNSESAIISVEHIGLIKTKKSVGNNFTIGAVTGATTLAILGAATTDSDDIFLSQGGAAALGLVFGGAIGAGIGGLTALSKNSRTIEINGDRGKWKKFMTLRPEL